MATNNTITIEGTTTKSTYPVLGMSCASCAASAQSIVQHEKGVVDASVNFATGNLIVEYNSSITNVESIKKAVQSVGYDLLLEDESTQQDTLEEIHENKEQIEISRFYERMANPGLQALNEFVNDKIYYRKKED